VAGAARAADIFSPGAIDYIFRCSEGIPRNINNLCDNALLNGFAAGEPVISRAIIEEVAATFDLLPRDRKPAIAEDNEAARIFSAAGRAELWAAGNGNGNGNGHDGPQTPGVPEPSIVINEFVRIGGETPATLEDVGAAFSRSGLGRGNNGQSL